LVKDKAIREEEVCRNVVLLNKMAMNQIMMTLCMERSLILQKEEELNKKIKDVIFF